MQRSAQNQPKHPNDMTDILVVKKIFVYRVDVPLIFKNVRNRKKVYNKCKSEKIPKADSATRNRTTVNCKLFLQKSTILDVSQVLSLPLITT